MHFIAYYALLLIISQVFAENCVTPNNETAQCVSLFNCPIILKAIQTQDKASLEFYGNSTCGGTVVNPMVCCGTSAGYIKRQSAAFRRKLNRYKTICGLQHSDDYFRTINETALSEFPWFAKVIVRPKDNTSLSAIFISGGIVCSGSLIAIQYVLTSASCLTDEKYEPILVRLGEYNLLNSTDCVNDSNFYECSEGVQDFRIKEVIPHPDYKKVDILYAINDIGLIRLNKSATFSDYVRPICLPSLKIPSLKADDTLITIKFEYNVTNVNVKPKLFRKYIDNEKCQPRIDETTANITLDGYMCSLSLNGSSALCEGNSLGSPVMVSRRTKRGIKWYVVGVVAGRYANCVFDGVNIYSRVGYYLDWIKENLNL